MINKNLRLHLCDIIEEYSDKIDLIELDIRSIKLYNEDNDNVLSFTYSDLNNASSDYKELISILSRTSNDYKIYQASFGECLVTILDTSIEGAKTTLFNKRICDITYNGGDLYAYGDQKVIIEEIPYKKGIVQIEIR